MTKTVKAWAWVYTDPGIKHPIISINETKAIVAEEKRNSFYGNPYSPPNEGARKEYNKSMRILYRQTKVIPVTITYKL